MKQFITKHQQSVSGVLSGWDRILFRGSYRILCVASGMMKYLWHVSVLLKNFGDHAEAMTRTLLEASQEAAHRCQRPIIYLPSSAARKEDIARRLLRENPVDAGLVCVLKCVEPCMSYEIYRNRAKKILELKPRMRKCKFIYHYWIDPRFGFMSARIQTWFPFSTQICVNGREWLSRRMDKIGLPYKRYENSFPWIDDRQWKGKTALLVSNKPRNWPWFQTVEPIGMIEIPFKQHMKRTIYFARGIGYQPVAR